MNDSQEGYEMREIDPIDLLDRMRVHCVPGDLAGLEAVKEADLYFYGPDDPPKRWLVANGNRKEWIAAEDAPSAMVLFAQRHAQYKQYDWDFRIYFGLMFIASPINFETEIPPCAVAMRSTKVLVEAGLMQPRTAKGINRVLCGKAII